MSETMVVNGVVTSYPAPGYGAGTLGGSPGGNPSEGQIFLQVTLPYYHSTAFCENAVKALENLIRTKGASDPLTIQQFSNSITNFLNADTNLCNHPKMDNVWAAFHTEVSKAGPLPGDYNYNSMSLKQMSGNVTTPLAAFGHYMWGNGEERYVNLPDVGLKINPQQIPELMNIVNSGVSGSIPVDLRFSHDTYDSGGVIPAAYLGHITLHTEGVLEIQNNGVWTYNGVIRSFADQYDFNLGDFRGPLAEAMTFLGSQFTGKPYQISLPGQINVSGSGNR